MAQAKTGNPTITALFNDVKWGEENYVSAPVDAKAFDAIASLGLGDRLLLKVSKAKTKSGDRMAFLEIVKSRQGSTTNSRTSSEANI